MNSNSSSAPDSEPAKPMTRRDIVRKSAFSTGSLTLAGLILAHGEALGVQPGGTTTATTAATTVSACGEDRDTRVEVGWGKSYDTPSSSWETIKTFKMKCENNHLSGLLRDLGSEPIPSGESATIYDEGTPTIYNPQTRGGYCGSSM